MKTKFAQLRERREEMRRMRNDQENPHTLQEIADHFGISRQRVHQILGNTGRPWQVKE